MKKYFTVLILALSFYHITSQIVWQKPLHPINKDELFVDSILIANPNYSGVDSFSYKDADQLEFKDTLIIKGKSVYLDGIKIKTELFYPNGQKYVEINFNKFGKDGLDISFYRNGKTSCFVYYKDGEFVSPKITWYENGQIWSIIDFINENVTEWRENGDVKTSYSGINKKERTYK